MSEFKNKKILVTGGTGSFGSAIVRELLKYKPAVVRILDTNENRQFELQQELSDLRNLRFFLGDVRDEGRLVRAFEGIDIVFHTAALKHVLACEYNPFEAVKTNVIGMQNLINAAMEEEVEKVIFTSSDKAVNPSNTMGATKLLAEKLMVSANYYRGERNTIFSCIRFGNVLGSSGSVVPLFRKQIRSGGPVTITDPDMTRFVMSMPQAVNLVLKATEFARGGEIFISKMKVLRIMDLAKALISEVAPKYGHKPEKIKIKTVGAKYGEKLYEELMTEEEVSRAMEAKDMFVILPQIKDLLGIDYSAYSRFNKARISSYKSKDLPALTENEIKSMLHEENLLF